MASNKDLTIDGAVTVQQSRDLDSNVTETTPLVMKNSNVKKRKSGLLRRLRESVLIKSKAANMILFWNTMVYLIYGFVLNPDIIFTIPVYQLESNQNFSKFISTSSLEFINMIGSGVYGLIAVWLLFYPLAGYLADVRYGRYKVVVSFGLRIMWMAVMVLFIGEIVFNIIFWPIAPLLGNYWLTLGNEYWNVNLYVYIAFSGGIGVLAFFMFSIGFAAFAANVIQFGIDQLQDLPARDSFLFIHWLLLTQFIGVSIGKVVCSTIYISALFSLPVLGLLILIFIIAVPLSLCMAKSRWFISNRDTGIGNPYREVARVVDFARRHKIPIQRSAFTYWEDDIPTGLDLGKSKYGGPFTTEQVENVKAFFGILFILLSLGPTFTADIAASAFLPILKHHMHNNRDESYIFEDYSVAAAILNSIFASGGTLYPILIVILIPVYLKIINPLFKRYIPSILKRIGIGLCLITLSLLCSMLIDSIGHALPRGQNATSVFYLGQIVEHTYINSTFSYSQFKDAPSLQLNPYILIIQNFLVAVAYILIYGGVFEFICAQSPHSMKGVLIGIFFAVKGLFQLIGVLGILLPFSLWKKCRQAGLVYFLVNILISVIGVVAFTVTARRYQYREREDFCNERQYIEDFYEKEVSHNPDFEDLEVNFDNELDNFESEKDTAAA